MVTLSLRLSLRLELLTLGWLACHSLRGSEPLRLTRSLSVSHTDSDTDTVPVSLSVTVPVSLSARLDSRVWTGAGGPDSAHDSVTVSDTHKPFYFSLGLYQL